MSLPLMPWDPMRLALFKTKQPGRLVGEVVTFLVTQKYKREQDCFAFMGC